jgi:hypothetical protein
VTEGDELQIELSASLEVIVTLGTTFEFTVTVALPVKPPPIEGHLESEREVI